MEANVLFAKNHSSILSVENEFFNSLVDTSLMKRASTNISKSLSRNTVQHAMRR